MLFTDVDGTFPNHHPDPTGREEPRRPEALVARKAAATSASPSTATATASARSTGKGRVIWGDQLLMILAGPVLAAQPGATIIADVKASQMLFDRVRELGGVPLMWKTGHSLIKSKMKETGAPLAGEMSGHIFFSTAGTGSTTRSTRRCG